MNDDVFYKDEFVWSKQKNDKNKRKHHISFETASLVFDDPFYMEVYDKENSTDEERFRVTGTVTGLVGGSYVTVSVTYRDSLIRIFSARDAVPDEIRSYNEILSENA
ncbi:hypothetical protein FACS189450_11090 [Spirochaetia bacterium]|nr:hypothetical protein FACS189450_11090 [Spirochaetia bacterium]